MLLFLSSISGPAWAQAAVNLWPTVEPRCFHFSSTPDVHDGVYSGFISDDLTPPSRQVFYLDIFFDRPVAPQMGEWGDVWYEVAVEGTWAPGFVWVAGDQLPWDGYYGWVDVIVDTEDFVAESDEADNVVSMYVESPCGL